jgi:hypothetical protein
MTRGSLPWGLSFAILAGCTAQSGPVEPPPPPPPPGGGGRALAECAAPKPEWVWCDDFEQDRFAQYFEYDSAGGAFAPRDSVGWGGSRGMRVSWAPGRVSAGALHLAFGRTPAPSIRPVDQGIRDYRELYWRLYVKNQPAWVGGGGYKLSRAQILASPSWAQAMLAPVWSGSSPQQQQTLMIDPASGTDASGTLLTTQYNDQAHLHFLGAAVARSQVFATAAIGSWYCVEAHVRLNTPGQSDGVFELWIDDQIEATRAGLNWVGGYSQYGLNAVFVENYWNNGAPKAQERYIDRLIVSTARIGCLNS